MAYKRRRLSLHPKTVESAEHMAYELQACLSMHPKNDESLQSLLTHSFTQVSSKNPKKFLHIFGTLKMQDASKLNWALKSFPKGDFRGFWIFYSTKNLLSNDTKISFLRIFSGFNPISTGL